MREGGWWGGGAREELHGQVPDYAPPPPAPPEAAGAQYFAMTPDEEEGAPAASRPAPVEEVRPLDGMRRHTWLRALAQPRGAAAGVARRRTLLLQGR